jgi:ParB family transcriptional regulator, chromosome partitioning protein
MMEDFNKTQKKDVLMIDPRVLIIEEGFNTRQDFGDLEELADSIIANGVKRPLSGYKKGENYVITDGERRLRATMIAINRGFDIARIPFLPERPKSLQERTLDIAIMNDGKPLTSLELGETYKRLINFGLSITEISKKTGRTYKHVTDLIGVADSPENVKEMIKTGQVSATLVAEVNAKTKDVDKTELVLNAAKAISTGKKVTKKDIQELKPEKNDFTADEVRSLLRTQIKACAKHIFDIELRSQILATPLVLNEIEYFEPSLAEN